MTPPTPCYRLAISKRPARYCGLKKETIITAVVFFVAGFLAGYVYDAQRKPNAPKTSASRSASRPAEDALGGSAQVLGTAPRATTAGLPEGHPQIDGTVVIKELEDQAAQNPKAAEPRLKLANFLYDQKQYDKAIEWYQKALELDPGNVNARTDLGTAYFYLGRPQDALSEYRKSLETNPRHEPTLFNMIIVNLEGTRDFAAAQDAWQRLHRLNPNYPELDTMKGRLDAALTSRGAAGAPR